MIRIFAEGVAFSISGRALINIWKPRYGSKFLFIKVTISSPFFNPTDKNARCKAVVPFETKKAFVVSKLVDAGGTDEIDFTVKKMTTPHADVANYIKVVLEEIKEKNGVISKIDIKHMAGGKDDDAAKLKSVLTYVTDVARQEVPSGEVSSEVVVSPPPPSETGAVATYMSATNVRKHAYQTQLPGGNGYDDWPDSYKTFYGPSARDIFNEILYPLEKITESERVAAINEYVDPVPKPSNRKSTKTQKKTRGGRKTRRKSRIRKKRTCH